MGRGGAKRRRLVRRMGEGPRQAGGRSSVLRAERRPRRGRMSSIGQTIEGSKDAPWIRDWLEKSADLIYWVQAVKEAGSPAAKAQRLEALQERVWSLRALESYLATRANGDTRIHA